MSQVYILVVDDEPDVRQLMLDALESLGLKGRAVTNGREAIEAIQAEPPALVLLDLMMPGMDGFSALARLQRDRELRTIPIVIMSALADTDRQLYDFPGVIGVMPKGGFDLRRLRMLLKRAGILEDDPPIIA